MRLILWLTGHYAAMSKRLGPGAFASMMPLHFRIRVRPKRLVAGRASLRDFPPELSVLLGLAFLIRDDRFCSAFYCCVAARAAVTGALGGD